MITVKHYICPRQSGKTTFAENLQKVDPSLLLITPYPKTDIDLFYQTIRGQIDSHNCYTGVIIDEFLHFANQKGYSREKFLEIFVSYMGVKELILISTPDRMYSKNEEEILWEKFLLNEPDVNVKRTDFGHVHGEKYVNHMKSCLSQNQYLTDIKGEFLL